MRVKGAGWSACPQRHSRCRRPRRLRFPSKAAAPGRVHHAALPAHHVRCPVSVKNQSLVLLLAAVTWGVCAAAAAGACRRGCPGERCPAAQPSGRLREPLLPGCRSGCLGPTTQPQAPEVCHWAVGALAVRMSRSVNRRSCTTGALVCGVRGARQVQRYICSTYHWMVVKSTGCILKQ